MQYFMMNYDLIWLISDTDPKTIDISQVAHDNSKDRKDEKTTDVKVSQKKSDKQKKFSTSREFLQTLHKMKSKLMKLNCFVTNLLPRQKI